ncbi:AarF/UbiB family protein [Conexibacter sp. SYSU D00693]|uniref:AarF/UbiB family protein n=1 Tax=Conexibacter sp. SYSU D00693 TaxID=2812560 RepID=UPI00196A5D30|nr:AarF/UbiB family protein [Conexibacter sp. SYSU D00693]
MARPDVPPALQRLLEAGTALARRSSAAQVALGRLHGVVDPAALPSEVQAGVAAELEAAHRRSAQPIAERDVDSALKKAWGDRPGKVLDAFDEAPAQVLPHGQVHHGEHDGTQVAITVLRPGLAQLVRSDLALLDLIAGPLGAVLPRLDAGAVLREVRERALDELDLEHEAGAQRRAARALRRAGLGIRVAPPVTDLCAHDVAVAERIDGPTLLDAAPEDPGAVARAIVRLAAGAPRELGVVLADLRADEVVVDGDEVVVRRVGAAREVDAQRLDACRDAVAALRADDAAAFGAAVARTGVLDAEDAERAHALLRDVAGDLLEGPATLDAAAVRRVSEAALRRVGDLFALAQVARPDPADLWAGRAFAQAVALLARLEATEDWLALVLEAFDEGWTTS